MDDFLIIQINNKEEMIELAKLISMQIKEGDFLELVGDMGAGKTFFCKALVKELGSNDLVTSPTYSILNEYNAEFKICHYDFYRIIDQDEAEELGLIENFYNEKVLCIVEWGDNVKSYLPTRRKILEIIKKENDCREVNFYERIDN